MKMKVEQETSSRLILFLIALSIIVFAAYTYYKHELDEIRKTEQSKLEVDLCPETDSKLDYVQTRDFMRYECKNMKRIGGPSKHTINAPHPLFRIDGAWFICMDNRLAPKQNDCNVLSFGINTDYSFDIEMNRDYGCRVFSFDPMVEADLFSNIRASNKDLAQSFEIRVNPKWVFYKLGLSGKNSSKDVNSLKMGNIADFNTLIKLTNLEKKVIDVLKIDIEGPEKIFFDELDLSYACTYFRQIVFETHQNFRFRDLVKLEECFLLFRRDTRFFDYMVYDKRLGFITEFQAPKKYTFKLQAYHNDTYLAEFMFVTGELYFINRRFLYS